MLAGKADGSGQSTKAPFQQLYDIDGPQVPHRVLLSSLSSLSLILCLSASHPLRKLGHPCLSWGGAGALVARLPHLRGTGGATSRHFCRY